MHPILKLILSLCLTWCSVALSSMNIEADHVEYQFAKRSGFYHGHVHVKDEQADIFSNEMETFSNERHKLNKIHFKGAPVHYQKKPNSTQKPLEAYADEAFYFPEQSLLQLIGHAKVLYDGHMISADWIEYHLKNHTFKANVQDQNRVHIILKSP